MHLLLAERMNLLTEHYANIEKQILSLNEHLNNLKFSVIKIN